MNTVMLRGKDNVKAMLQPCKLHAENHPSQPLRRRMPSLREAEGNLQVLSDRLRIHRLQPCTKWRNLMIRVSVAA